MRRSRSTAHLGLLIVSALLAASGVRGQSEPYSPPETPRAVYDFNPGWRFIREEVRGCENPGFDDSSWAVVSTPHTYNDVDSFDGWVYRGGERDLYQGPVQYRKRFKLPASAEGNRIVLEFEGMRQAARFWVNGEELGLYEDGVTAYGLDITDAVHFGDRENVLAVWLTNGDYREKSSGVGFQWSGKDFNPNYGGINRNVRLHVLPPVHQTLPLLNGLGTKGVYVYASDHDVDRGTAEISIESQVRNSSNSYASITLWATVVDAEGNRIATFEGDTYDMVGGETAVLKASDRLEGLQWWSPDNPYLYEVHTALLVDGEVADLNRVTTGFRKTEYKGGARTGGVYLNDEFIYLKGYAQRTTNEWAAIGAAYPDWMHDWDMRMMADGHANYMRWMHIAPRAQEVAACDRVGIIQICPAGDKEKNPQDNRQWEQRVEVMRATMVYFRNSPSILFWEAGNHPVDPDRLEEMVDLRKELDPSGGRVMGYRGSSNNEMNRALDEITEWYGVMVGQDRRTENLEDDDDMFRAFSYERRDRAPVIETEDFRDESLRRYWDDFTPPHMGFEKGENDTYEHTSESFVLWAATRYNDFWSNRISNDDEDHARWSGYASIIWADSNQHGRMPDSAVCRVSGKVDSVRIPKQAYFLHRVMQNEAPDVHIVGHWTYPEGTRKTMYVAANHVDEVELFVNGDSVGTSRRATRGFIHAFEDVEWEAGSIRAVARDGNRDVAEHELATAGEPAELRLTVHTGPEGLQASGSDVAFIDFEVVDAEGVRCPTDESRVDFEVEGPAVWRGGVNEFKPDSINHTWLLTDCGINRVFIRSKLEPGTISLTARREGLPPATVTIEAHPYEVRDGLAELAVAQ